MKHLFYIISFLFLLFNFSYSQWVWQNPSPQGKDLNSVHFIDNQTGWAVGAGDKILKTTDGGNYWTAQSSGTGQLLSSVYFTDSQTGWIVGLGGTILKTTTGGSLWTSQSSGSTDWLFSVTFNNNKIGWATGDYGTILKTTNGGATFFEEKTCNSISGFQLFQNYPNPFNPSTVIEYEIPTPHTPFPMGRAREGSVTLKIYDVLGREIETLVNEQKPSGRYSVQWNAGKYSSGIYYDDLFEIEEVRL